jgi:KDO2-lipid IV(A) lauroyltransferase
MQLLQWRFFHPRFWFTWLGLGVMWLTIFLPANVQIALGRLLSILARPLLSKKIFIANRNLELCLPELSPQQRQQLIKDNLAMSSGMLLETASSWWASDKALKKRVTYQGLEHLEAAKAKDKGIILLTGHFTSMEMGGRLMMMKTPCYVMFRHLNNQLFNEVMMGARTFHSEGVIMRDDPRAMLRALRKNKVVWYAPDQDFGLTNSVFATFFGVQAATITATARMAKLSGATVLPFVPLKDKHGHYTIKICPAFENFPSGDDLADAQKVNDWLEQEVRLAPEQYLWVHRRFKTQPEGNHLLYGGKL